MYDRSGWRVRGLLAACGVAAFLASPGAARAQAVAGRCSVEFFGTTTLHDFEGKAPCSLLAIESPDAAGHYAARAEVAVAQMDTDNSSRDKRMREMFEAKKFPRIVATFASVDPAALRARKPGALPFKLAIHGVEKSVSPTLESFSEVPGKSARFQARFALSLKELRMEAPVVMGFIKVDDHVNVVVTVELAAQAAPSAPAAAPAPSAATH
jgi:hypothetical protein